MLSLPEDLEPYADEWDDMRGAGAYALVLDRPDDFAAAWDDAYDVRPEWFDAAAEAEVLAYVGGSNDVLYRLENHRDGKVRTTALTNVCEIDRLHTAWLDDETEYSITEFRLATMLDNERETWFVRQR